MKLKNIFIILSLFVGKTLFAQNTFPTSGNVGIGTTNPNAYFGGPVLQIEGQRPVLRLAPSVSGGLGTILFKGSFSEGLTGSEDEFHLNYVSNPADPYLVLGAYKNGHKTVLTLKGGGNVGIGTESPSERLVVNGNIKVILDQANLPNKNVMGIVSLEYSGITGAKNWALRGVYQYPFGVGNNADGGDLDVIKSMNGAIVLATKTDGTALGNVGIGITNPAERLAVNGMIRAKEIKVESTNWPDYVFEKNYQIASLGELEKYIKTNKHLPEMPSATEVESNGVELGDLVKKLLKNQEELTLHLIAQQKTIKALEKKIISQQSLKTKSKRR
ncbi:MULTISPECIES: hypothetical protein [unclassified Pedobacter]|uniref:hypothetical protein n=1 Tax=unclassified Pedobacter TaxID=2628915 RepID=UPI001DCFCE7A|nr:MULTISPECIES: hypothetical protein [unclassified Pedobacter]CAH0277322.1 hypothetical protein SRABI36_03917 [Pedobacter sp. Bi36]CAH0294758.1 hypothetical protein SRABI126_04167 [Pedobacter sp. Bi126]